MKQLIKRLLPRAIRKSLGERSNYCRSSYSQEGEDRILFALLGLNDEMRIGFYVDVGAHHPERYSNTRLFYENGWHGINIDAMPQSMRSFERERPRDINIEAAISEHAGFLTFYEFNEPTLNGFSRDTALTRDKSRGWKIIRESQIETIRLETLLQKRLPPAQKIDFMSIDVEGLDFEVLKSNNWAAFRPAVVLVEDNDESLDNQSSGTKISDFMEAQGYSFCCKTLLTKIFVDRNQIETTPVGLRVKSPAKVLTTPNPDL